MESACLCLACQRGLAALLASNPPPTHSPTRASMRRPSPFTARMGPRTLDRAGAIHGLGCFLDPSSPSGDPTPGRGTGILSSAQGPPRVHGVHGVQANPVPSPKSQTHQQGSHLLISLERSGVENC